MRPGERGTLRWERLITSETPVSALDEIAIWLGAGIGELALVEAARSRTLAEWKSPRALRGPTGRRTLRVPGEPEWLLVIQAEQSRLADPAIVWAGEFLTAWREAQRELSRAETRLTLRTRELDLLQTLGSRAADARSPFDLFHSTLTALEPVDLALVAHALDGKPEVTAFLSRPISDACLDDVQRRATRWLGWPPGPEAERRRIELNTFDALRDGPQEFKEQELVLLPILRRERAVACMVIAPAGRADERQLRILFSAANQLCLHLDRILTVREAEADRFRSILDAMPQAVLLADPQLRVVQANRSAEKLFESLGLGFSDGLQPIVERMELWPLLQPVLDGRATVSDGEATATGERLFSVTVSQMTGTANGGGGVVLVFSDTTESRRLQVQLAQAEKMSSLGQMISGVAHELNNPLTSILGYVQLVALGQQEQAVSARLEMLQREAERCQKIVQNLLSFARRRESEWRPVSLNEIVRSVLSLLGYHLRVDDIEVRTDLCLDLPAVDGETHQLQQLLVNLLTNAQQAIRSTSDSGWIRLRTAVELDGDLTLEISDSGPGIPRELRSKIFDPFFTTKGEGQGTGLGLSLVYEIVHAHRGTISADEAPGGGALFRIRFGGAAAPQLHAVERVEAAEPLPVRPSRILIVDDEVPLAQMISDLLVQDGHATTLAHGGREALERLAVDEFDLIISDVKMPGMDGEGLYREICRMRPELARRLLLTTGDIVGRETDDLARRTGLSILKKPFDPLRLREAVRSALHVDS